MRPAARLQQALKLTLFTRPQCPPCHSAKVVLSRIWRTQPFEYEEIDVSTPGQEAHMEQWGNDTPVVGALFIQGYINHCS
jgi:glutaredoxin